MRKLLAVALVSLVSTSAWAQMEGEGEMEGEGGGEAGADVSATGTADASAGGEWTAFKKGTKGLQFNWPAGGAPTLGMTYFLNPKAAVHVDFGLALHSTDPGGGADRSNTGGFSVDLAYRMYKPMTGKVSGYMAPGVFLSKTEGVDFGDALSGGLTFGLGLEYWVHPQFSLGGATGVMFLAASNGAGSFKNIAFTTGTTALFASFYW